jgi:hypothetical protein
MNLNKKVKHTKRNFFLSFSSISSVVTIFFTVNMMLPVGKGDIVYAMYKPFDEVKMYHGIIQVPVDLEIEKNDQKSVDAGHSPWRLDPVFVSQVFVSLKLLPQGIVGDYPIKTEDLKLIKKNCTEAIVEIRGSKTPIKQVYLKRLVRQDSTGIWTVVGYDPK